MLACALLGLVLSTSVAQEPKKIEWAKSLAAAMALSAKDGRPVISYFTFDT